MTATSSRPRLQRIPNPNEPVPRLAWPTVVLQAVGLTIWICSTWLVLTENMSWQLGAVVNWFGVFLMFSALHESAHYAISSNPKVNEWLGRCAAIFYYPVGASYRVWRYVHMQHHAHTNDESGLDPDAFITMSPRWQVPFRFLVGDVGYIHFYVKRIRERPKAEWRGLAYSIVVFTAVLATAIATGHVFEWLVLYIVPARVMLFLLAWGFDWLPHHGLRPENRGDRLQTTRNIIGLEWLLTPLFFCHNYHLVHHVHPKIPFYKYLSVWARNEDHYLAREPAMNTPTGRPLSAAEYRARLTR